MNKCKGCKWWVESSECDDGRLKTCENPKNNYGYGIPLKDIKDDEILIESDEGWAWLTGPEYGCINWEADEQALINKLWAKGLRPSEDVEFIK
jgi:hypothetical protein